MIGSAIAERYAQAVRDVLAFSPANPAYSEGNRHGVADMRKKPAKQPGVIERAARPDLPPLDAFDIKILGVLRDNARASNVEIADKVGLTESTCSRRIKRLEEDGVITGYSVGLEPEFVGIGLIAFVTLVLENFNEQTADRFAREIQAMPEVMSCHIVSGGYDALLQVAAADLQSYSKFVLDRLRLMPGVKDLRSSFVMRSLKDTTALPIARSGA
jgi:DNA-binding Lrp family transcriptional regulator